MSNGMEIAVLAVSLMISLGLGVWFLQTRTLRGLPLLDYEPRRPVPWNALAGCLLASLLLLGSIVGYASAPTSIESQLEGHPDLSAEEFIQAGWSGGLVYLTLVVMIAASIAAGGRATLSDFGLPTDGPTYLRDAKIGFATMGLSFGPVILIQVVVSYFAGSASRNPTLLVLQDSGSVAVFSAAFFVAVIAAPIFEEFVCRLLLQGWLEKTEARLYELDEANADADRPRLRERAAAIGLVPGFAPVLISSLLFALLHLGAGPDPVALFPFALIQGYLYLRTHRILPCVFFHMLFNATALILTFATA